MYNRECVYHLPPPALAGTVAAAVIAPVSSDMETRLRCLDMAFKLGWLTTDELVSMADKLFNYAKNGMGPLPASDAPPAA